MYPFRLRLLGFLLFSCLLSACRTPEEDPQPLSPVAAAPPRSLEEFRLKYRSPKQVFTADAGSTIRITGAQGLELRITKGSLFTADSLPVTGMVEIELIEIYSNKDMLLHDRIGKGYAGLLYSQGVYYLRIRQNGRLLQGYATVTVPAKAGNAPASTKLYTGMMENWDPERPPVFSWASDLLPGTPPVQDSIPLAGSGSSLRYSKNLRQGNYSWHQLARSWPFTFNYVTHVRGTWSSPAAAAPEVFVVLDHYHSIRRLFPTDSLFGAAYQQGAISAPIGEPATLIALQYEAGKFYFGKTHTVITRNQPEQIALHEISEAALLTELTALD